MKSINRLINQLNEEKKTAEKKKATSDRLLLKEKNSEKYNRVGSTPKKSASKNDDSFLDNVKGFLTGEKIYEGGFRDIKKGDSDTTINKVGKLRPNEKGTEIDRFIAQSTNSMSGGLQKEIAKRTGDTHTLDSLYNDRKIGEGGGKDLIAQGLGYIAPGTLVTKGVRAIGLGAKAVPKLVEGASGLDKVTRAVKVGGQLAKEGAIVGGLMGAEEVAIREGLNPNNQNWKQNLGHVGFGVGTGLVADPLIHGVGKGLSMGAENIASRFAKGDVPTYTGKPSEETLSKLTTKITGRTSTNDSIYDNLIQSSKQPKYEIPEGQRVQTQPVEEIKPQRSTEYDQEFDDAVKQQYEYLKNSMGKGTQPGGLVRDKEGYVTGAYGRVSNNPKWYQDFYAENKRRPNNKELMELAKKHVKEGFEDELGGLPPFTPKRVQELDDEIDNIVRSMGENPEESEALKPILQALEEDRSSILDNYKQNVKPMKLPKGVQALRGETIPFRQPTGDREFKEMGFFESAINKVTKKYEKPITQRELMDNMKKNFGVTLRHGRMGKVGDEVKGFFKVNEEVIRTKNQGDIQVLSHEIGHHLDKQFNLSNPQYDRELMALGMNTSDTTYSADEVRAEGIAEYIRLLLTDPQKALSEAPNFSQYFDSVVPSKVKKGLLNTQNDVDRWIEQGDYYQAAGKIDHEGDKKTISDSLDKTYSQLIDKYDIAKQIEKDITGKVNDASNSLYKRLRLSAGAPKIAERYLTDLKRILQPIDKYGYNKKEVSRYIAMVHARDLEAHGIESGFTRAQIDSVINKLESDELKQVQKQLVMYSNNLLDLLVQSGRLSQESVNAMRKKYPNYVPFFRYFDEDMASGFGNKGFANLTNPIKRMKGSTKAVIDPLENMVKNTFAIINTAEKNKVGLELLKLADIEGAGKYVEVVPGNKSAKENVVTVYKDGEPVQVQLDKDLHRVIQRMDEESSNIVLKMLSIPAQTLRAGATLTPEFMLRNPIRDQFHAFVVSENDYFPPRDLTIGLWHAIRGKQGKSAIYEQWARSGGGYGNTMSVDRNYLREQLKQLKKEGSKLNRGFKTITNPKEFAKLTYHVLQSLSELSEEATKVGEFRRATKKGKTLEEAAFESRDLMDFARSGNSVREANRVVAFLNANIQGKDKLIRTFKSNPTRTLIKSITGVTLPAIGSYLAMQYLANDKQKETWQNAPQWLKDSFFFVPIPGTDVVARIPKPFDLAPMFASPVENFLDHVYNNDPATLEEFAKGTAVSLLKVPYMLTGIAPLVENWANKSFFTGGPIVPMRDQNVDPDMQYGVNTSLTARTIGKYTNYSPYKVDNLIRGYGAGLGKYATSGLDKVLEGMGAGKMPPQEAKKWSELPVLNTFTVDNTGGGKVVEDFYTVLDKFKKEYNTAKRKETKYENEKDYKYLQYKVGKKMSELNAQYREILGSYKLSPTEKRRQLDEIDTERKDLAREALSKIGE